MISRIAHYINIDQERYQSAQRTAMTRREAINRKCYECVNGDQQGKKWLKEVTDCPDKDCDLHPVRPMTRDKNARKYSNKK